MSKNNFNPPVEYRQTETDPKGHANCEIYGCPLNGHTNTGNWNCRFHWNKLGHDLATITKNINNNLNLIRWHDVLLTSCPIDYDLKIIHKQAIEGFEPLADEDYYSYKKRIHTLVFKIIHTGLSHKRSNHPKLSNKIA